MVDRQKGIVLHAINFRETSVIAGIYTEHYGMQSFIVKGVRKPKSKIKPNLLQPLTLVEVVSNHKENRSLQLVSDLVASPLLLSIPYDIAKSAVALFIAEVLSKSIREAEASSSLFDFLMHIVLLLDQTDVTVKQFHHHMLLQLSRHLGFFPHGAYSNEMQIFDLREGVFMNQMPQHPEFVSGMASRLMYVFANTGYDEHHLIETTPALRMELLENILHYYQLHALHGLKIHSHKVLEEVLA